ncbi:MAG: stalk domain-containing protein [Candidatus Ornithomonoglobus sp.]
MNRRIISIIAAAAMLSQAPAFAAVSEAEAVGASLKVGGSAETAAETQALIDARPDITRFSESLNRGLTAVMGDGYGFISWRWQGYEALDVKYNLYKNGKKVNSEPLSLTNYTDISAKAGDKYAVAPVENGAEGEKCAEVTMLESNYFDIPLDTPPANSVNGEDYTYFPGDCSTADLDGDGELEIVLKWDPSNAKDAAQLGFTGECIIDAYKLDGTRMWRVNMGRNIRSGAHDTQFMVYDFDGDGKAEMICRTADGTVAGDGTVIGDKDADYASANNGKNLTGPLYLTAFNGADGTIIDTVPYDPQTFGEGYDQTDWGDSEGNRSERYLAGIGSFDGDKISALFCRGYYMGPEGPLGGRIVMGAYTIKDGRLVEEWRFDSKEHDNMFIGQGNHSLTLADVDYDGKDEVIYGACAVDHDGTPMYSTGLGHGDAQHVSDLDPSRPGLEVYSCHEDINSKYSYEMRDARTGEILYGGPQHGDDNGRGTSDDIDPRYPGAEGWSAAGVLTAADGTVISNTYSLSANFLAWWDGDLGREVQNDTYIQKWNPDKDMADTIFVASDCTSINYTKATPCLTADILGDWREETIYPLKDGSALRVFSTTIPTGYRIPTLLSDTQYRNHVAIQNTCYNQPTHVSYYLGYDTQTIPVPRIYINENGTKVTNPDLSKKIWAIDELYFGKNVELAMGCPTALINGMPKRIDNDDINVVPFLSETDNTLVPIRFISEAFGAEVEWEPTLRRVIITLPNKDKIEMTVDSADYEFKKYDGTTADPHGKLKDIHMVYYKTMETAPVIVNDVTRVPLRVVAEALGLNVYWNDGLIIISDKEQSIPPEDAAARLAAIKAAPVPARIVPTVINEGERFFPNQLDIYAVEASGNDGNLETGAVDLDLTTRWSANGPNTLTVDLGSEQTVTGVAIAMWKGAEREYPFLIEVSTDGTSWTTALPKTKNSVTTENLEEYIFPEAVTARYVRYNGDGDTVPGKNYCHISEFAVLGE